MLNKYVIPQFNYVKVLKKADITKEKPYYFQPKIGYNFPQLSRASSDE